MDSRARAAVAGFAARLTGIRWAPGAPGRAAHRPGEAREGAAALHPAPGERRAEPLEQAAPDGRNEEEEGDPIAQGPREDEEDSGEEEEPAVQEPEGALLRGPAQERGAAVTDHQEPEERGRGQPDRHPASAQPRQAAEDDEVHDG